MTARSKESVTTEKNVVDFISELQSAAGIYSALLSANHEYWDGLGGTIRENVETLLRLELEQNRPLLLAALQHLATKEKKRLLRSLVSWSVRGLVVGGIGGGTAEKAYCGAAVKIRSGDIRTAADVRDQLKSIIPSDADFQEMFAVARIPKAGLARYILTALERAERNEPEPEFVPNANEDEVNLEHILPKRASKADWGKAFSSEERKDYLHRVGNLALLQKGPNGLIGNKPFSEKRSVLSKSKYQLTSEVGKETDWTKDAIAKRQARLAKVAVQTWPIG